MTSDTCPACGCGRLACNESPVEHEGRPVRSALIWTCPDCGWMRREAAPVRRAAPLTTVPQVWMN